MIRALLLILTLSACAPQGTETLSPRPVILADGVVLTIRVDATRDAAMSDVIAAETARLLGPVFDIRSMTGRELILNMTGRTSRADGTLTMDWDVRDQGGTSIALFRVAIVSRPTLGGGINARDARGLAFYTAEKLTRQQGIRDIVIARRAPQGG